MQGHPTRRQVTVVAIAIPRWVACESRRTIFLNAYALRFSMIRRTEFGHLLREHVQNTKNYFSRR